MANKDIISIIKYNESVIKIQIWAASSDYMRLIDVCNVKKSTNDKSGMKLH